MQVPLARLLNRELLFQNIPGRSESLDREYDRFLLRGVRRLRLLVPEDDPVHRERRRAAVSDKHARADAAHDEDLGAARRAGRLQRGDVRIIQRDETDQVRAVGPSAKRVVLLRRDSRAHGVVRESRDFLVEDVRDLDEGAEQLLGRTGNPERFGRDRIVNPRRGLLVRGGAGSARSRRRCRLVDPAPGSCRRPARRPGPCPQ